MFSDSDSRVWVAPPVLVRLPQAGLPAAVLAGARSPATQNDIERLAIANRCRASILPQHASISLVPARFLVESDTEVGLRALSTALGIHFAEQPAAWLLSCFVGTLNQRLKAARLYEDGELNWPRKEFDCVRLQFRTDKGDPEKATLIRYTNPERGRVIHLFRVLGRHMEVDCDWGRYAALREAGRNVLTYDERKQLFAVPVGAPLPRLFARSLALCSGYAPVFVTKEEAGIPSTPSFGLDIYRSVPSSIANQIAEKLCQDLVPRPINVTIC